MKSAGLQFFVQEQAAPILIFDGACALCSRSVRFVLRHERAPDLRFAAMQSEPARRLLRAHGLDPDALTSVVYIDGTDAFVRSRAVLALAGHLRAPWRWCRVLGVLPRFVLDSLYRLLARYRYAIFGRIDACPLDQRFGEQIKGRELGA